MDDYGVYIYSSNFAGQTGLVRVLEEDTGITYDLGYQTIPFTFFPPDGSPQGKYFIYFSGTGETCVVDVIIPNPSVTPSITPTISVTPSITPTLSLTPSITPSITVSQTVPPSQSITPSITQSTTPPATPSYTPSVSVASLCLYVQLFEQSVGYLPPTGYLNSRPYFEYISDFCSLLYRIYYDGTQWVHLDVDDNYICETMNYSGTYPDTNLASWVQNPIPPVEPPYCQCEFTSSIQTYPAPCLTPPISPSPSPTPNCCQTYEWTLSTYSGFLCTGDCTLEYLDCNNVWQTTTLTANSTTTVCIKYSPNTGVRNYKVIGACDCYFESISYENCDCTP